MCLTVPFHNLSPGPLWYSCCCASLYFIHHAFLHPIVIFFSQHMPIPSQPRDHTDNIHLSWLTTHTHPFNGPLSGTTRVSGARKVKPIWILLKQETVSGNGIIWAICKSAPRSRQITMPAPHHSVFYRPGALPAAQPTVSKHRRQ